MKSRNQKIKQRVLDSLREKAELTYNKGPVVRSNTLKPNKKKRRHSGRKTIFIDGKYPYIETFWNEWENYRDGWRGNLDGKKLRKKWNNWQDDYLLQETNKKIKKKLQISKLMKLRNNPEFSPQTFFKK